jgi:hypothetical protein
MNNYERAVIEAARALDNAWKATIENVTATTAGTTQRCIDDLSASVAALNLHEQRQATAGVSEIEWSLVAAGDELRGKSGAFFPVIRTRREVEMGKTTGRHVIEVGMPGGPRSIVRPNGGEPFATVRRGPDGAAVDEFVSVFSSGEK